MDARLGRAANSPTVAGWLRSLVAALLLGLAALFALDRLYDPARFRIVEIIVRGPFQMADPAQVKAAVAESLRGDLSGNYFSLQLDKIEARLKNLPWVFAASVRRQWPDALVVQITEVQPVAQWGARHWLHTGGQLVARETGVNAAFAENLPYLFAPNSAPGEVWRRYQNWSRLFAALSLRLVKLELDAREIWRVTLAADAATPVEITVPYHAADARVRRLARAFAPELNADFAAMHSLDLRYPNGFAVGWKSALPAGAPLAGAPSPAATE